MEKSWKLTKEQEDEIRRQEIARKDEEKDCEEYR